jgi:hypothetical protein
MTEEDYRWAELPEDVRAHRVNTTQAGITFRGNVTDAISAVFWGKPPRYLTGTLKLAYEAWKRDCQSKGQLLATRTCLFQGFVGFYLIHGDEFKAIVKGLARFMPDVIVLLTSTNQRGHTLRGSVFVRYRSEVNARAALSYFHGRQFVNQHLRVTLCNRETQLRVGDEKGKMAGGKAVSNENITLGREDIIEMEQYDAPMDECWGEINVARAFRVEYQGEGRRAHQTH